MKLYEIDLDYLQYLHEEGDSRVLCHNIHVHTRKFVAVGVLINNHKYYVPLSSPDKADYVYSGGIKQIRKTKAPTIMRLIEKDQTGNEILQFICRRNRTVNCSGIEIRNSSGIVFQSFA